MGPFQGANNEKGSILVLIIIISAVLAICGIAFSTAINSIQKEIMQSKLKINKEFDLHQIVTTIKAPDGLEESAGLAVNGNLYTCLHGGPSGACTQNCCVANQNYGFFYIDPADNNPDVSQKIKLVGPEDSPIFYTKQGTVCTSSTQNHENCAFSIWGTFSPVCPGWEANCDHAEHLNINIHLVMNPYFHDNTILTKNAEHHAVYFNDRNYKPSILSVLPVTLYLDAVAETEISIGGYSGHPSEKQNFFFTQCFSENPAIVVLTTPTDQPFSGGVAKIKVKPVGLGTTKITVQISDGGLTNNISDTYSIDVQVLPGAGP